MLLTDLISQMNFQSIWFSSSLSSYSLFLSKSSSEPEFPIRAALCIILEVPVSAMKVYLSQNSANYQINYYTLPDNLIICYLKMQLQQQYRQIDLNIETCEICYSNFEKEDFGTYRPGLICYECWIQHINTVIKQISYKTGSEIISPIDGKEPIDICVALNSLRPEHSAQLEEWLFKKYSSFTTDIQKCPSENCDYVFTKEECKWGKEDEKCPKCEAVLSQSTTFDLKNIIGLIYFLFITNKCPKCEIPIEKTTGCPHMTCPCGHQFCWYCLKDYFFKQDNVYSVHEPKECASIFLSKIIFTSICICGIFLTFLGNQIFQKMVSHIFFGIKYLMQTLMLDLIIAVNIIVVNNILSKYRNYNYYQKYFKLYLLTMVSLDIAIIIGIYYFQALFSSLMIILVELGLVIIAYGSAFLITESIQTWFEFIC